MTGAADDILRLIAELGFVVAGQDIALGQPAGIPTTMTVLGDSPLAVMFRFRVNPQGTQTPTFAELLQSVPDDRASFSVEEGYAFLTLFDSSGLTSSSLGLLVKHIAETLAATDLAAGPGCLRCGTLDEAELLLIEGRPTRLCAGCLDEARRERQEAEAELNRASVAATIGLPAAGGFVAIGWVILWTAIDMILEWLQVKVIEFNRLSEIFFLALVGGVGYGLGWPLGAALRQSIAIRRAPVMMSLILIVAAAIAGEIGYLALHIFRVVGVFDLGLAAKLLWQFVSGYSGFWIACKLAFLGAIGLFCAIAASERKQVSLNV